MAGPAPGAPHAPGHAERAAASTQITEKAFAAMAEQAATTAAAATNGRIACCAAANNRAGS